MSVEEQLRDLAEKRGEAVDALVEQALREYLVAASVNDLEARGRRRDPGRPDGRAAGVAGMDGRLWLRRAEIWWADLPPPVGSRPVLHAIGSIVVALVTRTIRGLSTEVVLGRRQGLPVRCVANLDDILTVPRDRLQRLLGSCDAAKVAELGRAMRAALDVR